MLAQIGFPWLYIYAMIEIFPDTNIKILEFQLVVSMSISTVGNSDGSSGGKPLVGGEDIETQTEGTEISKRGG